MKKCYTICKKTPLGTIELINYEKVGFNVKPKNKIKYPGIKVNSVVIINPSFIEKILKTKIKKKLNIFMKLMVEILEDDDTDPSKLAIALNEMSRYRSIIVNKYRKFLEEKYVNLLLKKIDFLEREITQKITYIEDNKYEDEIINNRKK